MKYLWSITMLRLINLGAFGSLVPVIISLVILRQLLKLWDKWKNSSDNIILGMNMHLVRRKSTLRIKEWLKKRWFLLKFTTSLKSLNMKQHINNLKISKRIYSTKLKVTGKPIFGISKENLQTDKKDLRKQYLSSNKSEKRKKE